MSPYREVFKLMKNEEKCRRTKAFQRHSCRKRCKTSCYEQEAVRHHHAWETPPMFIGHVGFLRDAPLGPGGAVPRLTSTPPLTGLVMQQSCLCVWLCVAL